MKKTFLVLAAMTALLSAEQSNFDVNELQNSCNNNDATECMRLGVAYYLRQDYKKANELYYKACDLGYGPGCSILGAFYEGGEDAAQDYNKANELFSKGCELGDGFGCFSLGAL